MVNQEILWGLKAGVERGQTLKRAMLSFYNAGYDKQEIEEAARTLREGTGEISTMPSQVDAPVKKVMEKAMKQASQEMKKVQQNVSGYEQKRRNDFLPIIILVVILVFLLGALISVFIFRQQLTALLGKLF